jgi:lipoprotein-releasing system permease protein
MYISVDRTFKNPGSNIESTENWDLNVDFQSNLNISIPNNIVDNITNINGVSEVEVYTKGIITAMGEKNLSLILQGSDLANSSVHSFTWKDVEKNNQIPEADDEIAISSVHALKLNKQLGDKLMILNARNEEFNYTIVGIHHELVMTVYITLNAGQDLLYNGSNVVDGLYVILEDSADRESIIDIIYDMENIEVIFDMELMISNAVEFVDNYALVVEVVVLYTLLVSFFIVFYNSVMNVYDKNYEYGILRSLGYTKKSTFKLILIENFLQGIIPITLALIFTFPLTYQLTRVYEENFPLVAQVGIPAIFMVTVPPIILYILGSLIGLRTVYKQNLYEQVQTRFVG